MHVFCKSSTHLWPPSLLFSLLQLLLKLSSRPLRCISDADQSTSYQTALHSTCPGLQSHQQGHLWLWSQPALALARVCDFGHPNRYAGLSDCFNRQILDDRMPNEDLSDTDSVPVPCTFFKVSQCFTVEFYDFLICCTPVHSILFTFQHVSSSQGSIFLLSLQYHLQIIRGLQF